MSVETVIAIVTAIIAFCTSVASFTYNLIQNRKNRIQKIILDNRIRYMNEIGGDEKDISLLKGHTEDFTDKHLKFDWAYWKYIQRQKEGNYMNSHNAFDAVYYDFVEKLNKN